ncbi:MAG: A/G-specific adenine glycosylase [Desulfovibrio sp.]|jgi:A/G-specific adenine glycosylase|nr:A/G-specific adenine glycosylase [Desulfovibrio sp.]
MSGTSRQQAARPLALPGLERGTLLPPEDHIPQVQAALLDWFAAHGRPLPWRVDYTPYEVWISEVMLQQTQMDRGVLYFTRWIRRFPDIAALAAASEDEVLRLWEGLGYYSRARRLHAAARRIMEHRGGVFPSTLPDIRALPGVGAYTAAAVASIAFNTPVPCVDANVERVLARVFNVDSPVGQAPGAERIHHLAERLLPEGKAREHNQAVMELGALVCGKKTRCGHCPLAPFCLARHHDVVRLRPVPGKKTAVTPLVTAVGVLRHGGRILMQKRPAAGIWGNLWEFPGGAVEDGEDPQEALLRVFQRETGFKVRPACRCGVIRHGYTTYRIVMHCFGLRLAGTNGESADEEGECPPAPPSSAPVRERRWVTPEEPAAMPLPAPHRKLAERIAASGMRC